MVRRLVLGMFLIGLCCGGIEQAIAEAPLEHRKNWEKRWVQLGTNLLVESRAAKAFEIVERAAAVGYNGVMLADTRLNSWFNPQFTMPRWERNATRLRERARQLGLELWVRVMPFGYAGGILAHDVNLATGLATIWGRLK